MFQIFRDMEKSFQSKYIPSTNSVKLILALLIALLDDDKKQDTQRKVICVGRCEIKVPMKIHLFSFGSIILL